jgi:hypothetical protein
MDGMTPALSLDFLSVETASGGLFGPWEGIFGLLSKNLNPLGTPTFTDLLPPLHGGSDVLAFELCASPQGLGTGGTLWLGGYDPSRAAAAPAYTPLVSSPYFGVSITDMAIGGKSLGLAASAYIQPIIATSNTYTALPDPVYNAVTTALSGPLTAVMGSAAVNNMFGVPDSGLLSCWPPLNGQTASQVYAALPAITLSMPSTTPGGTITITIPPQSYLVPMDSAPGDYCFAIDDGGSPNLILGTLALRGQLTIIDPGGGVVGFAPQQGCP